LPRPYIGRFTSLSLFTRPAPDLRQDYCGYDGVPESNFTAKAFSSATPDVLARSVKSYSDISAFGHELVKLLASERHYYALPKSLFTPFAVAAINRLPRSKLLFRKIPPRRDVTQDPEYPGEHRGSRDQTAWRQRQTHRRQSPPIPDASAFSLDLTSTNGAHRPARRS
jgi:hypothetical protein